MNAAHAAWIARMEQLRAQRVTQPGTPNAAERKRLAHDPAELRRRIALRTDASLRTIMEQSVGTLKKQRRDLASAASAWRDTVDIHMRDLGFAITLMGVQRGVLLIVVANQAQRFLVEGKLRGGAKKHFQNACRASIRDIRIVTGKVPPPVVLQDRQTRTRDEAEQEIQDHLDAGLIDESQAAEMIEAWKAAECTASERDDQMRSGEVAPE